MTVPHSFTAAGAQRIVNAVRRVEGANFDGRTPPQPKPAPKGQGGFTQWVTVTSATPTDGRHPGTWSSYDVEANSWTENGDCWVVEARGVTLSTQRYLCRLQGTLAADGLPVFMTVDDTAGVSATNPVFVRITSSTAVTGNLYPALLQSYTVAGGYADTATAVRVQFPNNEVPGLARVSAVYSGETSGGEGVYQSLERPLTVAATDAGTGDANATYYGISTLNINQGTGLALTNSSLSCKVAAQSASATHSGVVDLNAGQVLGSGGKVFRSYVYVNSSQQAAVGSMAFNVAGNINTSILNCYVTTGSAQTAGLVRVNTSVPTSGADLIVNGTTFNAPISTPVASIRVQGQVRADERYRVGADVPGFTGLYQDGLHTRMVIQGGIITGVF